MKKKAIELLFTFSRFKDLRLDELYDIMAARQEVFVTEQKIVYVDCDNKDQSAWHLVGRCPETHQLIAYLRVLEPGVKSQFPSIGRVLTRSAFRTKGYGRQLMAACLKSCKEVFPNKPLVMSAQAYLKNFYQSFGFQTDSNIYIEEGIEHIHMRLDP